MLQDPLQIESRPARVDRSKTCPAKEDRQFQIARAKGIIFVNDPVRQAPSFKIFVIDLSHLTLCHLYSKNLNLPIIQISCF